MIGKEVGQQVVFDNQFNDIGQSKDVLCIIEGINDIIKRNDVFRYQELNDLLSELKKFSNKKYNDDDFIYSMFHSNILKNLLTLLRNKVYLQSERQSLKIFEEIYLNSSAVLHFCTQSQLLSNYMVDNNIVDDIKECFEKRYDIAKEDDVHCYLLRCYINISINTNFCRLPFSNIIKVNRINPSTTKVRLTLKVLSLHINHIITEDSECVFQFIVTQIRNRSINSFPFNDFKELQNYIFYILAILIEKKFINEEQFTEIDFNVLFKHYSNFGIEELQCFEFFCRKTFHIFPNVASDTMKLLDINITKLVDTKIDYEDDDLTLVTLKIITHFLDNLLIHEGCIYKTVSCLHHLLESFEGLTTQYLEVLHKLLSIVVLKYSDEYKEIIDPFLIDQCDSISRTMIKCLNESNVSESVRMLSHLKIVINDISRLETLISEISTFIKTNDVYLDEFSEYITSQDTR